jgi:hypothetical protein
VVVVGVALVLLVGDVVPVAAMAVGASRAHTAPAATNPMSAVLVPIVNPPWWNVFVLRQGDVPVGFGVVLRESADQS